MRWRWSAALLCCLVVLAACWFALSRDRRIGQTVIRIPSDVSVLSVPLWLRMIPGLDDDSGEILVSVPAERVAAAVKGYAVKDGDVREDQTLLIADLNDGEQEAYRTHRLMRDFVDGRGRYGAGAIARIPALGVWRVDAGGGLFDLFDRDPATFKTAESAQSSWMGTCQEMDLVVTASGKDWLCHDYILSGRLRVGFHYGLKNLPHWAALRRYLVNLVDGWVVAPAKGPFS